MIFEGTKNQFFFGLGLTRAGKNQTGDIDISIMTLLAKGKLYIVGDLLKQIQYHRINTKRFRLEKRKSRFSRYLCKVFRGVT